MARGRSRYFLYVSIVMLAVVFIGFAPTFYLRSISGVVDGPTNSTSLPWHLVFHGFVMTAWYVLFVVQTWLVSTQRVAGHRKLGIVGLVVAALVVMSGTLVLMLRSIRRIPDGLDTLPPLSLANQGVILFQTYSFFFFALFIVVAVIYRRRAFLHKRLMLIASLLVLAAAFGGGQRGFRVIYEILPNFVVLNWFVEPFILASLFIHDWRSHRKIFAVTIIGAVVAWPARYLYVKTMVGSDIGLRYSEWLTSLLHNSV